MVQLASVTTRAGAAREWRALRRRFPKLLGDMRLSLDEAKLAGGASVVRLRTGAFADARAAAALCKRLAAKRQDCLVVASRGRRLRRGRAVGAGRDRVRNLIIQDLTPICGTGV